MDRQELEKEFDQFYEDLISLLQEFKDQDVVLPKSGWNILQHSEHVIKVNNSYFPVFEKLTKGKLELPFISKIGWIRRYIGKTILNSVHPDNPKRQPTFPIWKPGGQKVADELLKEAIDSYAQMKNWLKIFADPQFKDAIIHSPVRKSICYDLDMALVIILRHSQRHIKAIEQIKGSNY